MLRSKFIFAILTAIFSTLLCINVYADDVITIVTPSPAAKEVTTIPAGYISCFTVTAGWYKGVWYPQHNVCQYDPEQVKNAQGAAYVEGYWTCTKFLTQEKLQGQCTNWEWKAAHWIKTFTAY